MIEFRKTSWGAFSGVKLENKPFRDFSSFDSWYSENKAHVFEKLEERFDGCEEVKDGMIPTYVAAEGRAVIAAYLFGYQDKEVDKIAETLDISPRTVKQYIIDVRQGRR